MPSLLLPPAAIVRTVEPGATIVVALAEIVFPTASIAVPASAAPAIDQREAGPRRSKGRTGKRAAEEATLEVLAGQAVPAFGVRTTCVTVQAAGGRGASPDRSHTEYRQRATRDSLEDAAAIGLASDLP
jgi:hypothetical protein